MREIEKLLIEYLEKTTQKVREMADNGHGRKILGEVINRPDDIDIEIDKVGEDILEDLLKKYKIKATIFSEPEARDIKNGNHLYGSIDPFDGSILFLKGLKQNWYTALSFYNKKREPLGTGISDILNGKFYISKGKENYSLNSRHKRPIVKSKKTKLTEPIVLASYLMSSQYSKK